jgi:uncharacterized protein
MIVLDTTALVYAVGADHPLREPCRELIAALRDGRLAATTTPEVVQEFTHVRARRASRSEAVELANAYRQLFAPLMTVDEDDLTEGLSLFERHRQLGAFDSVLAAASRRRAVTALVSADHAFAAVPRLRHVHPGPDVVESLVNR